MRDKTDQKRTFKEYYVPGTLVLFSKADTLLLAYTFHTFACSHRLPLSDKIVRCFKTDQQADVLKVSTYFCTDAGPPSPRAGRRVAPFRVRWRQARTAAEEAHEMSQLT